MADIPSSADADAVTPRQDLIVRRVQQQGFAAIDDLAREFEVTPQTVRRDINALCERGLLRRYHGGAGLAPSVENIAYETRQVLNIDGKRRIAALVAEHIPDHASLSIGLGTTAQEIAVALAEHQGLRVVTNNLRVANALYTCPGLDVMVAGGSVRRLDAGVTGETAIDFFRDFKVDYAVFSISGIDADGTLLDFDYHEVRLLQVMMANARCRYLAADHTKIGRSALIRAANIRDIDAFFTDEHPTGELAEVLREADTAVHVAE